LLPVANHQRFQVDDIFIHLQRTQMGGSVGTDRPFLRGLIGGAPHHPSHLQIAGMLRHLSSNNSQERMRIRHAGAAGEGLRRPGVVLQFHVVDKALLVIEPPFVRVVTDAVFVQFDRPPRHAGPVWWLGRQEIRAVFVSHDQLGIKGGGDLEQRR